MMTSLIENIKLFTIIILLSAIGYYHFIYARPIAKHEVFYSTQLTDTVYVTQIQKDTIYIKNEIDSSYINKVQVPALLRKDVPLLKINK